MHTKSRKDNDGQDQNPLNSGMDLLMGLLHAHTALMNLFSREVGISPARLRMLHELMHVGCYGIGLSDLALRLGVTSALITRQVKDLENDGWIQRKSGSGDKRRITICLSKSGEIEVGKLHTRAHQLEKALTKNMDSNEIDATIHILSNLIEELKSWRRTGRYLLNDDSTSDI